MSDKPGRGTPEGEESGPRRKGKETSKIEQAQIEASKDIELSEDRKEIELAKIEAQKARYQMAGRVMIAVVVAVVAGLAVVYGRSFSSSLLTIGDDGTVEVETKTTGPVVPVQEAP